MQDIGAIVPELELAIFGMFLLIFDLVDRKEAQLGLIALHRHRDSPGFFLFRAARRRVFGLRRRAGRRSVLRCSSS